MNRHPQLAASAGAAAERWRRADLARDAQASGPHELAKLAAELGMPITTLRRHARVAKDYPEAVRGRLAPLTFSHFEVVVGLDDRLALLRRAAKERWSVDHLKSAAAAVVTTAPPRSTKHPIDDAISYIESIQGARSGGKPPLDKDGLILEMARVALTIIRGDLSKQGRADVA